MYVAPGFKVVVHQLVKIAFVQEVSMYVCLFPRVLIIIQPLNKLQIYQFHITTIVDVNYC